MPNYVIVQLRRPHLYWSITWFDPRRSFGKKGMLIKNRQLIEETLDHNQLAFGIQHEPCRPNNDVLPKSASNTRFGTRICIPPGPVKVSLVVI